MKSLRARLVVGVLLGSTVVLAGNALLIYTIVRGRIHREMDGELIAIARSRAALAARELGPVRRPSESAAAPLVGIDFAPWVDGQDPSQDAQVGLGQLRERLTHVAADAEVIRTYGLSGGLDEAGRLIHELGKEAVIGAWISGDARANEIELESLVRQAHAGHVDVACVGSEVLSRGDLSETQLRGLLLRAREELPPGIPLTTAETASRFLRAPSLVEVVDFVYVNIYPYWDGTPVDSAVEAFACRYQQVLDVAQGKPVVISETGWPSAGPAVGDAVPSPENAARFLAELTRWARLNDVRYCWFSALDESWKGQYGLPQEAHWGYRDSEGRAKPGVAAVLARAAPDPPADLELTLTSPLVSFDTLQGTVSGVGTLTHRIAAYVRVGGGWWSQPSIATPLTRIGCDGSWQVDVTLGTEDEIADRIAVFLVPAGYVPPLCAGAASLGTELFSVALDSEEVGR